MMIGELSVKIGKNALQKGVKTYPKDYFRSPPEGDPKD